MHTIFKIYISSDFLAEKDGFYDGILLKQTKLLFKVNDLICFPMKYRDFSVKINSENNSKNTIFIFTVCKNRDFYEFPAKSLARKV